MPVNKYCNLMKLKRQLTTRNTNYRENSVVKVALVCVIVAYASLAFISLLPKGWTPRPIMVEIHAVFAILTPASIK